MTGINNEFIIALEEIEKDKGISKEVMLEAIEQALLSAYKRNFGTRDSKENVTAHINRETGKVKVISHKMAVEEVTDPALQISLEEAREKDPAVKAGDIVEIEVTPETFGRVAAQTARQVVVQRIREAERGIIFEEFQSREGDIVNGVIQRVERNYVMIDLGRAEAILPPQEQIPGEIYHPNDRIKAYVLEVRKTTKGPQIVLSRTHPGLLKRLLELEVPEIHDGVVDLISIAREAGSRSKVAVHSDNPEVDPVGACVGPKGMRIQMIVRELRGEKIDVIRWDRDPAVFIQNALSPAKVFRVDLLENEKIGRVIVPDYQLSLAIGKEGQNARLAAKLTGWKIDIKSDLAIKEEARELSGQNGEQE